VPLEVVQLVLTDQPPGVAKSLFCCKLQPGTFCQYTVTMDPEPAMLSVGMAWPTNVVTLLAGNT